MLASLRVIIILLCSIVLCFLGCLYCLFSPRNPKNSALAAHYFSRLAPILGVSVEIRKFEGAENLGNAIYIANHQNNYDMIIATKAVQPPAVAIGKKSLLWIPLFGQLYWLSGNLAVDRGNNVKARALITRIVSELRQRKISFWIFPEGTRSHGRGLLPFKIGAFHAAIAAGVPIVPIVISNTNHIKLNRCSNGQVLIEMLPPIDVSSYGKDKARDLSAHCWTIMQNKLDELNMEIAQRSKGIRKEFEQ